MLRFSMVTNSAALGAVMNGPDGMLAGVTAGKIFVDMSTVSPAFQPGDCRQGAGKKAAIWWTRRFPGA